MSILIYAESAEGKLKTFELASYAKSSRILRDNCNSITVNADDVSELSKMGRQGFKVKDDKLAAFTAKAY
jgi:hypothetical protein